MWVSRREFEDLKRRVRLLEDAGVNTSDKAPDQIVWPGVSFSAGFRQISAARAVTLLAEHLGVTFRWKAEEKAGAYLEARKGQKR